MFPFKNFSKRSAGDFTNITDPAEFKGPSKPDFPFFPPVLLLCSFPYKSIIPYSYKGN